MGKRIRETGRVVVIIPLAVVALAVISVGSLLLLVQVPIVVALLLASVAPATAPAATVDVVRESEARGPVADTTLGVAAIDDAWGVILFSLLVVAVQIVSGQDASLARVLQGVWAECALTERHGVAHLSATRSAAFREL